MTTPAPLDQRLKSLSLGATTIAATTAGIHLALPEKAEAGIPMASGFFIATDPLTASGFQYVNIALDLSNVTDPISVGLTTGYTWGWQILYDSGFGLSVFGATAGQTLYSYLIFYTNTLSGDNDIFTATQTFNLADYGADYFDRSPFFTNPGTGGPFFFGLRRTGGAAGPINGWVQVNFGSVSHTQTVFNIATPSNITIGQVPEPSSALLLAAGSIGLLTARRRRKKKASTSGPS
ncbi:MAG: PEP-CTERM sorting domain-containing protein [Verrucomicrobiota bacterium]